MTSKPFRQGLFDFLDSRKILRELTPEAEKKLLQELRDKIGLSEVELQTTAFNNYEKEKVRNTSGFKLQIGDDKENTFDKLLRESEKNEPELKQALDKVFNKQDFYNKAKETYNTSIAAFKDIIVEKVPKTYSVEDIRGELARIQENAIKAIKAQQKVELEKFKTELNNQNDKLKKVLNIDDDEQLKEIKENLIKELESSHQNQLEAFQKTTRENNTLIDKAANNQMEQYIFNAQMEKFAWGQSDAKKRQEMFEALDAARAKRLKEQPQGNTTIETNVGPDGMSISALDPKDLDFFYTLTGKKIEQKKPGVWTIEFSPRILNPGYYLGFPVDQEKPKADLIALAQTIRAAGFDGIKMTVNFPNDPETEKKRLKEAYEACLEAGFPPIEYEADGKKPKKPQHIVLIDSRGQEVNIQELFKDDGPKLGLLHKQYEQQRKALDERKDVLKPTKQSPPEITTKLKAELMDAKNKGKTEALKMSEAKEKELEEQIDSVLKGPQ